MQSALRATFNNPDIWVFFHGSVFVKLRYIGKVGVIQRGLRCSELGSFALAQPVVEPLGAASGGRLHDLRPVTCFHSVALFEQFTMTLEHIELEHDATQGLREYVHT